MIIVWHLYCITTLPWLYLLTTVTEESGSVKPVEQCYLHIYKIQKHCSFFSFFMLFTSIEDITIYIKEGWCDETASYYHSSMEESISVQPVLLDYTLLIVSIRSAAVIGLASCICVPNTTGAWQAWDLDWRAFTVPLPETEKKEGGEPPTGCGTPPDHAFYHSAVEFSNWPGLKVWLVWIIWIKSDLNSSSNSSCGCRANHRLIFKLFFNIVSL